MPLPSACACVLCDIEARLLTSLNVEDFTLLEVKFSGQLHLFPSVSAFVQQLRTSPADEHSDEVLRELIRLRSSRSEVIESFLILAFVPMLHRCVRRAAQYQPSFAEEDIAQQALRFLLEFLRSKELQTRESHFAFAISRAVKRQLFEWGRRESRKDALSDSGGGLLPSIAVEESFERHAQLRHFLHRCVQRGQLSDEEFDLLIQFKLEGVNGENSHATNGNSSNAHRQKMKRLLAKLRRLAK